MSGDQLQISRRTLLRLGVGSAAGIASASLLSAGVRAQAPTPMPHDMGDMQATPMDHSMMANVLVGTVDHARNGFDPMDMLVDWDYGTVTGQSADGAPVREYEISAGDVTIEIAPGVYFPAWTYNGRVPGPTIRCREGDLLKVHFANYASHPHTMHFHGFQP